MLYLTLLDVATHSISMESADGTGKHSLKGWKILSLPRRPKYNTDCGQGEIWKGLEDGGWVNSKGLEQVLSS
jgi:hypothetical protein